MKVTMFYIAIFAFVLLLVPMIALNYDMNVPAGLQISEQSPAITDTPSQEPVEAVEQVPEASEARPETSVADEEKTPVQIPISQAGTTSFRILDETTGEITEVPLRDFVRGAVAAEMPVSFDTEALKAQAVAAHTFALHNHMVQQTSPDPLLKGADFAADPQNRKVYMTEEGVRTFYGEQADAAWERICEAADAVLPYILEYENEPIVAAYHAISSGQTEDASNVWSGSAPYLQPVDSPGDLLAPNFETMVNFSADKIRATLLEAYPELVLDEDPANWFGEPIRSGSGYVTEIPVGDTTLHGKDLRMLLDLRSHHFEISYSDAGFTFQVVGYGHGVGLSQYGADYYARQGEGYQQILKRFYGGATLKRIELEAGAT